MIRRIEGARAVEVFITEKGYVCIKQDSNLLEEDPVISVQPIQLPVLIRWLQDAADVVGTTELITTIGEGAE